MADHAGAGGWPLPPGDGEIITTLSRMQANERTEDRIDPATGVPSPYRYRKVELSVYAEYGLTKNLTAIGELAFVNEKTDLSVGSFRNIGLARIKSGTRYAIGTWEETLFSVQPLLTLHLEDVSDNPAMIQRGDVDIELALVLARNEKLFGRDIFAVHEIAWTHTDSGRPDEIRADITLGTRPRPGTMLLLKSLNTAALDPVASEKAYRASKLSLSVVCELSGNSRPGTALEAGVERLIDGQGTIEDTAFRIALWYRF